MMNELSKMKKADLEAEYLKLKAENEALKAGAIKKEKKASFNDILLKCFKDIALKQDGGALNELSIIIKGLASPADKWNYIAYSYQFLSALSLDEIKALKALSADKKSALYAFPQLGELFGKNIKEALSAESR